LFQLCRKPEEWDKLCQEVLELGTESISLEQIRSLNYTSNVIKEGS
jgi:hypothetical protein